MNLEWNKVTWYSKWGAVFLFLVVVPVLSFYIGVKYEEARSAWDPGPYVTAPTNHLSVELSKTTLNQLAQVVGAAISKHYSDQPEPPATDQPTSPGLEPAPDWCQPPNIWNPPSHLVPHKPGLPTINIPGTCWRHGPVEDGKQEIKICSKYLGIEICYTVRVDCSIIGQPCKIEVIPPSPIFPGVICEPDSRLPGDPPGLIRAKCSFPDHPDWQPYVPHLCYVIVDPPREFAPVPCPEDFQNPEDLNPPIQPTPRPEQPGSLNQRSY